MSLSELPRTQRAGSVDAAQRTNRRRRQSHAALRERRDADIESLKRLAASGSKNRFFDKAMLLLTRYWAETPWSGRAELLQTADWLITVGKQERPAAGSKPSAASADADRVNDAVRDRLRRLSSAVRGLED